MMPEFTYEVVMQTPLGLKRGVMWLGIDCREVHGYLNILGNTQPCHGEIDETGLCRLFGRIVTFTRSIDYSAFGMADEAGLDITLYSNKDVFHITGTICKPREGK